MIKPSDRQLAALTRALEDTEVCGFIEANLASVQDRLMLTDDPHVVRLLQGEARTYKAILSLKRSN